MRFKVIGCEVLTREISYSTFLSKHVIDPVFTEKEAHDYSDELRKKIQMIINETDEYKDIYDYIILAYGLCGNSLAGIQASEIPIIIPRAHDCCTLFLGSIDEFQKHFSDNLSASWSSSGYMERGKSTSRSSEDSYFYNQSYQEYVDLYGEDNAKYLWETLHPKNENDELIFIDVLETTNKEHRDTIKKRAEENNQSLRILQGNINLIKMLIGGEFDDEFFLTVPKGKFIVPAYDNEKIIKISDTSTF